MTQNLPFLSSTMGAVQTGSAQTGSTQTAWRIFARADLAPTTELVDSRPSLLLEGSWPRPSAEWFALDETIDARHAWVDVEAVQLAELAAERAPTSAAGGPSLAWLHALPLRYYAAQLLRVLAFAEEHWPAGAQLELIAEMGRDDHYAETLAAIAAKRRGHLTTRWQTPTGDHERAAAPPNSWLRRTAGKVLNSAALPNWSTADQVLLCGNPRLLEPVCGELIARGARPAWLFDRFAFAPWRRWLGQGVRQFVCNSSLGQVNRFPTALYEPLFIRGVDLQAPIARWLRGRASELGAQHTRLLGQVERCFARFKPQTLVLDEDATPLARAAVAAAQRHGVYSIVVQHGAPYVRFGFAPLEADTVCVWGESSRARLMAWGVPAERIAVTGAPQHDGALRPPKPEQQSDAPRAAAPQPQVLLLATTPPRDARADSAEFHLTTRTHRELLDAALTATAQIPGAKLLIKLHPRTRDASAFERALAAHRPTPAEIVRSGDLAALIAASDCVLSCVSSAGLEAVLAGKPVIQLAPAGGDGGLPAADWGLFGTATTAEELLPLLQAALTEGPRPAPASTFTQLAPAAPRATTAVVDLCLASRSPRLPE